MADFDKSFKKVLMMEFSDKKNALHKNQGENGLTYMGIYQSAYPNWIGWSQIETILKKHNGDIKKASIECYDDTVLYSAVGMFYDKEFYSKMKLNYINSQKIVDEMFCGGVNYGVKIAIKLAQRVIGVLDDGMIGQQTIKALNSFNDVIFDVEFDKLEIKHYESLVAKNPNFERFIKGWRNRALAV